MKTFSDTPFTYKKMEFDYNVWEGWYQSDFRPYIGTEYKNKGIVLFCCSYMYGFSLPSEETFAWKLSHLTRRPVYNLAIPGSGVQHGLMQIESHDYDDIIKNSEYAIVCPLVNTFG